MASVNYGGPDDPLNAPDHSQWSADVHAELTTIATQLAGHTHTDLVGPPPVLVDGTTVTGAPGTPANLDVVPTGNYGEYRIDASIPQGVQGVQGPPGPPLNLLGTVPTSADLPAVAAPGDAYGVTVPDPDELWVYGESGWVLIGTLTAVDHGQLAGLADDDHLQYMRYIISTVPPAAPPDRDGILYFVVVA